MNLARKEEMRINCHFKIAAAILLLLTGVGSAVGAISNVEREALIALYNSTNGDNWYIKSNWLGPPGTEGTWYGLTCDLGQNHVVELKLDMNNLVGKIPPELGNLKNLTVLYSGGNELSGTIPPELGNLKNLAGLNLTMNQLSGTIPPELGNLKNLTALTLSDNQLSGSIPPELGNLKNLTALTLSDNQLSGSIPSELGNLKNLVMLFLGDNQLSGSIPPELGHLKNLVVLFLSDNQLSGTIPPELGYLKNLAGLSLDNNQLSGSIPSELGNLKNLETLHLKANELSSTIPPELGKLTNLSNALSNFDYNALYTNDASLRDFLNSKQEGGVWEETQTVAPTNVTVSSPTGDSIKVSWTPIRFKKFSGGYRVFYSTSSGGPYTLFGTTADKKASFLTGTGLNPGTTYYFVVQTVTYPHDLNKNTVMSEYSEEASRSQ